MRRVAVLPAALRAFASTLRAASAVAALGTLISSGAATAQSDEASVILMLQTALQRVGCLAGEADGEWGPASKLALGAFALNTGQKLISLSPSRAVLDLVSSSEGQVCGGTVRSQGTTTDERAPVVADEAAPPQPACIEATVAVGAKPNWGNRWDTFNKAPDIVFKETSSSASAYCADSTQCRMRIMKTDAGPLNFVIEDEDDIGANDMIGAGQCAVSAQCNLPPAATITMRSC